MFIMPQQPKESDKLTGFRTVSTDVAYILYEVRISYMDKPIILKNLSVANRCKNLLKNNNYLVYVSKRMGFLDKDYIYCTTGYKYSLDFINTCQSVASHSEAEIIDVLKLFDEAKSKLSQ